MAVVPVEVTGDGVVIVHCTRVGDIADECIDIRFVGSEPRGIKVPDYSGSVDEITVVEMVVVVIGVSEISTRVASRV